KLKVYRERLGLSQKEFIAAVSEKLGVPSMNPSLASQWESNLKNRASPSTRQIKAIALLSDRPWEIIWWFMRDDLDHKRVFALYPDGTYKIAPMDISVSEEEKLLIEISKIKLNQSLLPSDELTAWMRDEEKMWSLYVKGMFTSEDQSFHRNLIQKANLIPRREPCGSCGGISSIDVKKCDFCNSRLSEGDFKSPRNELIYAQTRGSELTKSSAVVNDLNQIQFLTEIAQNKFLKSSNDLLVSPSVDFKVSDLVSFPVKSDLPSDVEKSAHHNRVSESENSNQFLSTVKFLASSDHAIPAEFFEQKIQFGDISQHVYYFDHDLSIQLISIRPFTLISSFRRSLHNKIMELCFLDRLKKRTSRKLVLASTYETGIDLHQLRLEFKDFRLSALKLGIPIRFVSGPAEVASLIAQSRLQKNLDHLKEEQS
ncbi:MAG: XRE family transcriptional regulator, partial [Crocinitomicaceae bacterium]|nr:XRE family transcriptional regulator [Crocinitomicaceae bacterium]